VLSPLPLKSATLTISTFTKYQAAIKSYAGDPCAKELLMAQDGAVSVYYAPFEWVNPQARVVLVGITPGKTQAANALSEAQRAIQGGTPDAEVLKRAKATGAFSGAIRPNLVSLLDAVGLHTWLGLASCGDLFGSAAGMLQTASVLQFPVFVDGENYNGTPDPTKHPMLRELVTQHFGKMCAQLPNAVLIPLGPVPSKVLAWLATMGAVDPSRVLDGLPHPSGANAERIKYFIGQKSRAALSAKTDPEKLDAAKAALRDAVARLR
jgi:hypothetical protein